MVIRSDSEGVIEMKKAELTEFLRQKKATMTSTTNDTKKYSK